MTTKSEDEEGKRIKVQIREKDLLCINGCGFYGTPQWENRCSKCWRAHQIVLKRSQDFAKNRTLLSFDQFQERRKSTTEGRSLSIKKIFKSQSLLPSSSDGSYSPTSTSPNTTPTRSRELSPDSKAARERLTDFLVRELPTSIVQEVTRQVKYAVNKIMELRVSSDDMSELVQGFYQYLNDKLNSSSFFANENCKINVQDVMDEVEKYICTCCYSHLFCAHSDEEVADVSLQDRIRSLHWVTAGFLETKLDFKKQAVRDKLDEAIGELIEVNAKKSTSEKLECLVKCSNLIFNALSESSASNSADEFLPVMIFALLRGNPPLIQSNVKFISRFSTPNRVMSGETAYFFTHLSCALQFVQEMNHDSLKMDKAEFEAYTSGQLAPPLSAINCACNQALFTIEGALDSINSLKNEQVSLLSKIQLLEKRVETEVAVLTTDFDEKFSMYPSKTYLDLRASILEEEKLTADLISSFSRQSSDSGMGTATSPSTPQPQLENPLETAVKQQNSPSLHFYLLVERNNSPRKKNNIEMLVEVVVLIGVVFALMMIHKQDIAKGGEGVPIIGRQLEELDEWIKKQSQNHRRRQTRRRQIDDSEMKTARSLSGREGGERFEKVQPTRRSRRSRSKHHAKHRSRAESALQSAHKEMPISQ